MWVSFPRLFAFWFLGILRSRTGVYWHNTYSQAHPAISTSTASRNQLAGRMNWLSKFWTSIYLLCFFFIYLSIYVSMFLFRHWYVGDAIPRQPFKRKGIPAILSVPHCHSWPVPVRCFLHLSIHDGSVRSFAVFWVLVLLLVLGFSFLLFFSSSFRFTFS